MSYTIEQHNLHGRGNRDHEVYAMPPVDGYWPAVTDVPCPVAGCDQRVVWYEAGYVPGYRVCMRRCTPPSFVFDHDTIRHRFLAQGDSKQPVLVRDDCCEENPERNQLARLKQEARDNEDQ